MEASLTAVQALNVPPPTKTRMIIEEDEDFLLMLGKLSLFIYFS